MTLISLLVLVLVFALLFWAARQISDAKLQKIAMLVLVVIFVIVLLGSFLGAGEGRLWNLRLW